MFPVLVYRICESRYSEKEPCGICFCLKVCINLGVKACINLDSECGGCRPCLTCTILTDTTCFPLTIHSVWLLLVTQTFLLTGTAAPMTLYCSPYMYYVTLHITIFIKSINSVYIVLFMYDVHQTMPMLLVIKLFQSSVP